MDYDKIYNQIIDRAKLLNRKKVKGGQYFEEHHIIPKCLGGSNDKYNIVLLLAREHYVCHKLLVLMYPGNKSLRFAVFSIAFMSNGKDKIKISSREYENLKIISSNDRQGVKHSEETLKKMSNSKLGRDPWNKGVKMWENKECPKGMLGRKGARAGIKATKETLLKLKESHLGQKAWNKGLVGVVKMSEETKEKQRISSSGRTHCQESKDKVSEVNSGVPKSKEHKEKLSLATSNCVKIKCPHCPKIGNPGNMKCWHFDNCKHKPK